jgi:hypothetical protein
VPARTKVHISPPEIEELAHQAKGAEIFAIGEYSFGDNTHYDKRAPLRCPFVWSVEVGISFSLWGKSLLTQKGDESIITDGKDYTLKKGQTENDGHRR